MKSELTTITAVIGAVLGIINLGIKFYEMRKSRPKLSYSLVTDQIDVLQKYTTGEYFSKSNAKPLTFNAKLVFVNSGKNPAVVNYIMLHLKDESPSDKSKTKYYTVPVPIKGTILVKPSDRSETEKTSVALWQSFTSHEYRFPYFSRVRGAAKLYIEIITVDGKRDFSSVKIN